MIFRCVVHRINEYYDKFKSAYKDFLKQEKKVDIFYFEDETHFIGIPFKGYDELYKKLITMRKKL